MGGTDDATEGRRNFPYPAAWVLFLASLLAAAGLLLSPDPAKQVWGLGLLAAPLVAFGLLMALFYWRSRRMAQE